MIAGHLQVKSGYWYAVLNIRDAAGKRKPKWFSTHLPEKGNKKKAEEILTKLRIEHTREEDIRQNGKGIYFDEYMQSWLAQMASRVSPITLASYRYIVLNSICPYFRERGALLHDIKAADIEGYYAYLYKRGKSNNTILRHHANIRKALQDAFRKELIPANPADRVDRPRTEDYIAHPYSADECRRLLESVKDEKLKLVVTLALIYGLRRSEVLGLRWGAIDFEAGTMMINHTINQSSVNGKYTVVALDKVKRSASYRTLPLIDSIKELLLGEKRKRTPYPDDYVCANENGNPIKPNYVSQEFPKLLKRHSLRPIRFHDLRHSCANLLISERIPLIEVQQWMGHSTISTTADLYSHLDFSVKQKSADTIKKI